MTVEILKLSKNLRYEVPERFQLDGVKPQLLKLNFHAARNHSLSLFKKIFSSSKDNLKNYQPCNWFCRKTVPRLVLEKFEN